LSVFAKGHDEPKRCDVHTSDSWSPYKIKGTQPKEDIENFGKRFGEKV
jgi:hypothetical protein